MRKNKAKSACRAVAALMVLGFLGSVMLMPGTQVSAAAAGNSSTMAVSMDGFYVLFPGAQAPYLKSGRLMVPVRAFANAIGAHIEYNAKAKSVKVVAIGQSVGGIRAGADWAVFEGDLGYALRPAPEIRGGVLFVPASPILQGLHNYNWEVMQGLTGSETLVVKDRAPQQLKLLLGPALTDDEKSPFPEETTAHPYPFFPLSSTLAEIKGEAGSGTFDLQLKLQNLAGIPVPGDGSELEVHAVNADGNEIIAKTMKGPHAEIMKAQTVTVHAAVPKGTQYVLFRSRILK